MPASETADSMEFQSTLPAWGATRLALDQARAEWVSIHAPRVGSDGTSFFNRQSLRLFQSTLPAWGATDHRKKPQTA